MGCQKITLWLCQKITLWLCQWVDPLFQWENILT